MLTACASTPATIQTPAPTPEPTPVLEVQMPWQSPDAAYSSIPAGEEPRYFYDKPLDAFVPSEDYGKVYPYAGEMQTVLDQNGMPEYFMTFGLCTGDGTIITAPIYTMGAAFNHYGIGDQWVYLFLEGAHDVEYTQGESHYSYRTVEKTHIIHSQGHWMETVEGFDFPNLEYDYRFDFLVASRDRKWGGIDFDGNIIVPFEYENPMEMGKVVAPTQIVDEETRYWCAPNVWANRRGYDYDNAGTVTFYFPNKTIEVSSHRYIGYGNYIEVHNYPDGSFDYNTSIYDLQGNELIHQVPQAGPDGAGGFYTIGEEENLLRRYDKNGNFISEWLVDSQEPFELSYGYWRLQFFAGNLLALYDDKLVFMDGTTFETLRTLDFPNGWNLDRGNPETRLPFIRWDNGVVSVADFDTNLLRTYAPGGTLLTTCRFGNE